MKSAVEKSSTVVRAQFQAIFVVEDKIEKNHVA